MATGYKARFFIDKQNIFEINGTDFALTADFTPPTSSEMPLIARGTSANRTRGGRQVGLQAENYAWSLSLDIYGGSNAELEANIERLNTFLKRGGGVKPLYFEWVPVSNTPIPLYGQFGAPRRMRLEWAVARKSPLYGVARGVEFPACLVMMECRPYFEGAEQRAATAVGGIQEDWIGTPDGTSRGLRVPEATTNKMTNPVYGNATWDTGWLDGAGMVSEVNTDAAFVLFGPNSARLTGTSATLTQNLFYQNINVGNTNTHTISWYVKLPDGGAVSASQCQIYYYTTARTTTYQAVGNGWYRLSCQVTGVASSVGVGLVVQNKYTVYVDGVQIEEKGYPTPLAYGDLLGHAWTGTVHASTSTRTAATCKEAGANCLSVAQGSFMVAWKASATNAQIAANAYLLDVTGTGIKLFWDNANTRWRFEDGVNLAAGSSNSIVSGQIYIFHATYGPAGLALYLNGASIGSNATFTPLSALPAFLFIGSTNAGASHIGGTFLGVTSFDVALTAAEVAADYANIIQRASGGDGYGQKVSGVLWEWTKDGDDRIDGCDDADQDNFCVIGGVEGDAPAYTDWKVEPDSGTGGWASDDDVWLGVHADRPQLWRINTDRWYSDRDGNADAGSSNGEYASLVYAPAPGSNYAYFEASVAQPQEIRGEVHYFVRVKVASGTATVNAQPYIKYQDGYILGNTVTLSLDTSFNLMYVGTMHFEPLEEMGATLSLAFGVSFVDADSFTLHYDYMQVINGPLAKLGLNAQQPPYYNQVAGYTYVAPTYYRLIDARVFIPVSGGLVPYVRGGLVELQPESYNTVYGFYVDGTIHAIADTTDFDQVLYRPRWRLL